MNTRTIRRCTTTVAALVVAGLPLVPVSAHAMPAPDGPGSATTASVARPAEDVETMLAARHHTETLFWWLSLY